MADTVKQTLMTAFLDSIKSVPEVKAAYRVKSSPIALDNVPFPAVYLWDEAESITRKFPNLAVSKLTVALYVFIALSPAGPESFNETGDRLQARVHDALVAAGQGVTKTMMIHEIRVTKDFPNDSLGVLKIDFEISFSYPWGRASG